MARKADSHHVLPLFCDDLIASCVDMTPSCFGAYMRLLCYAWTRGGIPDNEAACARIAGGIEPGDWAAIRSRMVPIANASHCDRTAIANGSQSDVRLTHPRLELERQSVAELRKKKSEAGKKGNSTRWGSQTDRKTIAEGIANASQTDRKTIAPNPSPSLPYRDIQPAAPVVATSDPPKRRKRSQHLDAVAWSEDHGWQGISATDRTTWGEAFPAVVLDIELIRCSEWLKANPARAKKSNWRRFLVSWLTRSQDRGGTNRSAGKTLDDVSKRQLLARKASEFAGMQPAPYRTPKEVAALAASLRVKEDT